MAVGFLQLVVFVDGLFLGVGGMKGPTIPPAHVEYTLGAVEVGPDGVLLGIVTGVFSVFPSSGEGLELEGCDLSVGSVGGLELVVEYGFASYGPATRGVNVVGGFFLGPPEDLVEPMHAPVTECAVCEVEEVAPASGMNASVEWTQGRGTAVEVPVETVGGVLIPSRVFLAASSGHEEADHAYVSNGSAL